jgi:hypothetical protein
VPRRGAGAARGIWNIWRPPSPGDASQRPHRRV